MNRPERAERITLSQLPRAPHRHGDQCPRTTQRDTGFAMRADGLSNDGQCGLLARNTVSYKDSLRNVCGPQAPGPSPQPEAGGHAGCASCIPRSSDGASAHGARLPLLNHLLVQAP